MKRATLVILILVLVVMALLAGCGQKDKSSNKADEPVSLRIGILPIIDVFPLVVAQEKGYFKELNLDVELVPFQSAVERDTAVQSGDLDGLVADLVATSLLKDSGQKVKIASLTLGAKPEEGPMAILAAPGSSIDSMDDLKGKSIGIAENSVIEYVTDGLLQNAGINPEEVKKTMVAKIPVRLEMLLNGQLDAATLPDPLATYAEYKGAKRIVDDTNTNLSQAVLLMSEKALDEKKEGVKRFFTAYAKAVETINESPEEYRELLVKEAKVPEEIKDTFPVPQFPLPQLPKEEEITNVLTWLKEKGQLKNVIKYDDLVVQDLY
jgi:NitT/TauT family transport system substrate-binding protein